MLYVFKAVFPPHFTRRLVTGLVALGAFTAALWAEPAKEETRLQQTIVVAMPIDTFPQSYLNSTGRCEGFAVDLLDALARTMDLKLERVIGTPAELNRRFESGEFDLLCGYSRGPGRELYAEFSDHYLILNGAIFVRKGDERIHRLEDLNGADLLLGSRGGVVDKLIQEKNLQPKSTTYCSSTEEALHLLDAGKYDAVFASRLTALSVIDRDHLDHLQSLGVQLVGYDIYRCFAVHKGDTALLNRLNEGLAVLHQTGEFEQIYRKWFGRFDSPLFTREQVITYLAPVLAVLLGLALLGLLHQRALRRKLIAQAARLAESEALLGEAQRIAHVGHWRYDQRAEKLFCSPEMLRILERDPQKSVGYFRLLSLVPRSERAIAHRTLREALRGGVSGQITLSVRVHSDRRQVLEVRFQPLYSQPGMISGLVGTIQDVTQQKVFEEDLRAREQLLRAIYDNVPSALGVVETAGDSFRFLSTNPGTAKLLGLDPHSAIAGRLLSTLRVPPDVMDFWLHWLRRGIDHGQILKAEPELEHGRRHLSLTLIPLGFGPKGNAQLCFLAEDISERKQIDAEIAQGRRLRAVGELVGGIAHEFNNLLTPILLKTELLSAEWRNELRLREELRTISRAAERGADLTKRLLAFGRRSEPVPEELKLAAVVRSNLDLLLPTIDRRIQLVSEVPDTLPSLFLNPSDLHQIILNLLLNARDTLIEKLDKNQGDAWRACVRVEAAQFGPRAIEGALWQKSDSPSGWICLTIRDNGMGMPQTVLERIFEPFYTTKGVGKGTGLGLATVWHLTTRMGGKVTVQSRVDEGSAFQVWLPVFPPPALDKAREPEDASSSGRTVRIFLVEDDELVAQTVSTTLRRQQHHVVHFRHGSDAWRHLSTHYSDYDLLMLDLDLPGISGIEIARRARASRYNGKILVASGRLTDLEARELDRIGVDCQIEKPFSPPKLHLAVQTCMAARKQAVAASVLR